MDALRRFWRQPGRGYRAFQIVFTVLTLNFAIPATLYTFAPEVAVDGFLDVNRVLGGAPYTFPEAQSRLWRYLGAANVMTLALMCALLQSGIRRFHAVLVPLVFMKMYAALCWLFGWLAAPEVRLFLAAAILDLVTSALFVVFATAARRDAERLGEDALVPRPLFRLAGAGPGPADGRREEASGAGAGGAAIGPIAPPGGRGA